MLTVVAGRPRAVNDHQVDTLDAAEFIGNHQVWPRTSYDKLRECWGQGALRICSYEPGAADHSARDDLGFLEAADLGVNS